MGDKMARVIDMEKTAAVVRVVDVGGAGLARAPDQEIVIVVAVDIGHTARREVAVDQTAVTNTLVVVVEAAVALVRDQETVTIGIGTTNAPAVLDPMFQARMPSRHLLRHDPEL